MAHVGRAGLLQLLRGTRKSRKPRRRSGIGCWDSGGADFAPPEPKAPTLLDTHARTGPTMVTASAPSLSGKILGMEFSQLHHPPDVAVLCDRKGCEHVADYLEVGDHGHEYRLCGSHTDSKTHASRLPTRKPSSDLPFRSRPAA
jgi:hypothetical protein